MEEASFFLLLTCLCPPAQMTSNINQGLYKEEFNFPSLPNPWALLLQIHLLNHNRSSDITKDLGPLLDCWPPRASYLVDPA